MIAVDESDQLFIEKRFKVKTKRVGLGHAWVLMSDEHVDRSGDDIEVSVRWFAVDEDNLDAWVSCTEGRQYGSDEMLCTGWERADHDVSRFSGRKLDFSADSVCGREKLDGSVSQHEPGWSRGHPAGVAVEEFRGELTFKRGDVLRYCRAGVRQLIGSRRERPEIDRDNERAEMLKPHKTKA